MKTIFIFLLLTFVITGCSNKKEVVDETVNYETEKPSQVELGKELFEGKGTCYSCHKPDQKIIAPSTIEIARIYKEQNGDIVSFLKGNEKPLVDPSQFEVMKTNFAITKNMTDEELKAIEAYMYSHIQ